MTALPIDVTAVRLAAALHARPYLILVEGAYHDQVAIRAEAIGIGAAAARGGARVVVVAVEGVPSTWRLIRRWNGAEYASIGP